MHVFYLTISENVLVSESFFRLTAMQPWSEFTCQAKARVGTTYESALTLKPNRSATLSCPVAVD